MNNMKERRKHWQEAKLTPAHKEAWPHAHVVDLHTHGVYKGRVNKAHAYIAFANGFELEHRDPNKVRSLRLGSIGTFYGFHFPIRKELQGAISTSVFQNLYISELGFDARTYGLWAHQASNAPLNQCL
jgi:hypothetical protein